ncbi:hypothetical protein HYZ70_03175 [Candidatus Curtissbacteria bacterium]|nr:hypothetical protein [Candidatus Collierbacteria bacterium]MBI3283051.1 hypothetical protein [Candidatus Curtissbacteria bacterium]
MITRLSAPVAVDFVSDPKRRLVLPRAIWWDGRLYPIEKVGLHHIYRSGRTLFHVFSVVGKEIYFRLTLNTETLFWQLEEISDGLPD